MNKNCILCNQALPKPNIRKLIELISNISDIHEQIDNLTIAEDIDYDVAAIILILDNYKEKTDDTQE